MLAGKWRAAMRFAALLIGGVALAWAAVAQAQSGGPDPYPVIQGKTYKFEKIADGVYYATGGFGSNNVVIVNDQDVLVVDTGTTPAAARAFIADIKMLTNKPIRYVVNTHWHFDHTDGNSDLRTRCADHRPGLCAHCHHHIRCAPPRTVSDLTGQRRTGAD